MRTTPGGARKRLQTQHPWRTPPRTPLRARQPGVGQCAGGRGGGEQGGAALGAGRRGVTDQSEPGGQVRGAQYTPSPTHPNTHQHLPTQHTKASSTPLSSPTHHPIFACCCQPAEDTSTTRHPLPLPTSVLRQRVPLPWACRSLCQQGGGGPAVLHLIVAVTEPHAASTIMGPPRRPPSPSHPPCQAPPHMRVAAACAVRRGP